MKKTQQAPPCTGTASAADSPQAERSKRRQALLSTAQILARGVTLDEVQQAVKKLRPQIHQVG
ncbi:MAG TPA: hypothetical protein VNT75_08175 [Symbiobacteriaceae bacterium]|nr:hypothetical protein [Symbiobacteriaceae bacterium]